MAKKKLTKVRIKKDLRRMSFFIMEFMQDKLEHPDSKVPLTPKKLLELNTVIKNAFNRTK